jgi:UDP-N-acetylglucosamine--N-acetylmuramyl-(pentapeptide) pyrophosphoryl-undecaprenol N-acetylglucosamine transferase
MAGTILICAGGTGGHLFPAEAVARVLQQRGWRIELVTDHRTRDYGGGFPAAETHIVASATPSGRGLAGKAGAGLKLFGGTLRALRVVGRIKPAVAVGFGGYPTVPPILAARLRGVPTIIHDQNAVLGRANRLLARFADRIATASKALKLPDRLAAKAVLTGNPVRPAVREAKAPYRPPEPESPIRIVVFGGSQGARFLSQIVPAAIGILRPELIARLQITQQCRQEDVAEVEAEYRRIRARAELATFFANLPAIIADSHLVISRSGATTVSELGVIGRPAILIPLPGSIDQDQRANAAILAEAGGGWVLNERTLDAAEMATIMTNLLDHPAKLTEAAAAAAKTGVADGAERLADLVEAVAAGSRKGHGA